MKLEFKKMHGIGNDFVIFDTTDPGSPLKNLGEEEIRRFSGRVADRHFGVGADGVLLVMPSTRCDYRMRIINADGSEAEMCGNGIRCFARFLFDHDLIRQREFSVETLAGEVKPRINVDSAGSCDSVTVDMGTARLDPAAIPVDLSVCPSLTGGRLVSVPLSVGEGGFDITCVSMGNPHAIIFVESLDFDIARIGPVIEKHPFFPRKTNVEFVKVLDRETVEMRVWERGVGETLGCGTGSSAAAVASLLNGKTGPSILVRLRGGNLGIQVGEGYRVMMTGPASYSFEGTLNLADYL